MDGGVLVEQLKALGRQAVEGQLGSALSSPDQIPNRPTHSTASSSHTSSLPFTQLDSLSIPALSQPYRTASRVHAHALIHSHSHLIASPDGSVSFAHSNSTLLCLPFLFEPEGEAVPTMPCFQCRFLARPE